MRRIILYSAVSIDGRIAGKDARVDWLDACTKDPDGGDYGYSEFISGVDATIMGYDTYRQTKQLDGIAAMADFTNYVLTRRKDRPHDDHVGFLSENILTAIRSLKKEAGKAIWLLGGGQTNTYLLNEGLIDSMILTVIPIILGEGIRPFTHPGSEAAFSLRASRTFGNGLVQSTYERPTS